MVLSNNPMCCVVALYSVLHNTTHIGPRQHVEQQEKLRLNQTMCCPPYAKQHMGNKSFVEQGNTWATHYYWV